VAGNKGLESFGIGRILLAPVVVDEEDEEELLAAACFDGMGLI
jgi:hypothetical protein